MRTIGLLGGMSWESSVKYYEIINRAAKRVLGGHHNAVSLMHTVDFAEVERMQRADAWDDAAALLAAGAESLRAGGAEMLLLCTNTMHRVAPQLQRLAPCLADGAEMPLLHIADPTARAIKRAGLSRVALLGTAYTMEHDFYKGRLVASHGLEVAVPDGRERAEVHRIVFEELVHGIVTPPSRDAYAAVIDRLAREEGAEAVILGCTEIGLLVSQRDSIIPVFDTTELHALAGVERALQGEVDEQKLRSALYALDEEQ